MPPTLHFASRKQICRNPTSHKREKEGKEGKGEEKKKKKEGKGRKEKEEKEGKGTYI
jgi:hypothetical protein